MNELEFKRHLKNLAHGHHNPEEHDWGSDASGAKRTGRKPSAAKRRAPSKASKRK